MQSFSDYLTENSINHKIYTHDRKYSLKYILKAHNAEIFHIYDPLDNDILGEIKQEQANYNVVILKPRQFYYDTEIHDKYREKYNENKQIIMQNFFNDMKNKYEILTNVKSNDANNRNPLPKSVNIEEAQVFSGKIVKQMTRIINLGFKDNPGSQQGNEVLFPFTRKDALKIFKQRFKCIDNFAQYQDAIVPQSVFLFHFGISMALNVGILQPQELINYAISHTTKANKGAVESFIRQIMGWREYALMVYLMKRDERIIPNGYKFTNRINRNIWYKQQQSGIDFLDDSIKNVHKYGYAHHIDRLMIQLNVLLLLQVRPQDIYEWFMTMYVDSAEWVMYFNVFCMGYFDSQFTRKPYICSSNYISIMSGKRYQRNEIVDKLYHKFHTKFHKFFKGGYY